MNTVATGGETCFPNIGMSLTPKQGLLIAWHNLLADGSIDKATMHQGKPVLDEGRKYILTQWFR